MGIFGWFVAGAIIGGIITIIMMLLSHAVDELKERCFDRESVVIKHSDNENDDEILSLFYGMSETMQVAVKNIMITTQNVKDKDKEQENDN